MQKHILIIEDNLEISELLGLIFELENYRTTIKTMAPDPAYLNNLNFDLIIMDIRLVGSTYNGNELCLIFKSRYPGNKTPVLLLSAEANGELLAIACRADGFLQKPFDITRLLTLAKEIMA